MAADKHEQIRRRTYEIWEEEGRAEGAAMRHRLQASDEDELEEDNEHETLKDLMNEDDSDDEAMLLPPAKAEILAGRHLSSRRFVAASDLLGV
ncbi:Protein of unknown function [Rhizobium miluonense]|uniref:DUF2934 domain-containing protein n=1 Tax=Rhizobium miluonense TaxID=411945 RepID=A0A1C3XD20_9HYPH|nr:Protein of unknown function [Rhizobium miluonense]